MNVGLIGTGIMGASIGRHLIDAGHKLQINNRTKGKAEPLLNAGASWANSIDEIAEHSEVILTMVGYPDDVRDVYYGTSSTNNTFSSGLLTILKPGQIIIDLTTSEPNLAQTIYQHAKGKSAHALDAPVSGGDAGAKAGTLTVMAGGDETVFRDIKPVLECFGKKIRYCGEAGKGQSTKLANQILNTGNMLGMVEALLYARKANLDMKDTIEIIGSGAAASWAINNLGPRILQNNFEPGFLIEHFVKDMQIALDEASRLNLQLPGLTLIKKFYDLAMQKNLGKKGTHALFLVLDELSQGKNDSEIFY